MKIKVNLRSLIIKLLYILLFAIAIFQMRYQLIYTTMWFYAYTYATYIMVIFSILYFLISPRLSKNSWNKLLLLLIIYELAITIISKYFYIGSVATDMLTWPLLSMVFCDYFSKNKISKYYTYVTMVGMVVIYILSIPNIIEHLATYGRYGSVIGPTYYLFAFLPLVYLTCDKKVSFIFSVTSTVLLVITTKRLGFLIVICGLILTYLSNAYVENSLKERIKKMWRRLLLIALALIVGFILLQKYNMDVLARLATLTEDGGSGRTEIWEIVIESYTRSSLSRKLFGHGFHAVAYEINVWNRHIFAHNSFLETLYDYGIIGLFLILALVWKIIRETIELNRRRDSLGSVLIFTIPIIVGMGLFGYFFEQAIIIVPVSATWGICFGLQNSEKRRLICSRFHSGT